MSRSSRFVQRAWHHAALLGATASVLAGVQGVAHATRPTAGAISGDRLKLPSGPSSVRGLADEPQVDPFYAQVNYQVPIELPAGLGQLAPALALTYSGALGNGPLGIGWTMPGVRIERSTRLGVPHFGDADELEISGIATGRLVALPGGIEYRLEGQGQTVRVRRVGEGFEVDDGDGNKYRLGLSPASRQEAGPARRLAWLVEEQTNLAGESIRYSYGHDQGQIYLERIVWGPGDAYAAELIYEDRPDPVTSYREGFRVVTARRLIEVRVEAFGEERRAYQLAYDDSFPVSRLAGVTSTGLDGHGEWPALSFDYATSSAPAVAPVPGVGNWRLNANGVNLVDLDGDGAAELLQLADGGHTYRVNQNGTLGGVQVITGNTQSISTLQLMDIDGDARADLLQDTGSGWAVWKYSKTKWLPQAGTLPEGVWPGTGELSLKQPAHTRFADLNGDGLVDAIRWDNDNLKIHQATRTGFLPAREEPRIGGAVLPGTMGRFQDANGDGLDDYLELHWDRLDVYIGRGDGSFDPVKAVVYPFTGSLPNPDDIHLADLDRDDLLDLIRVDLGTVRWFRGQADGSFSTAAVTVANPEQLSADVVVAITDVNGNGSQDVVWSSTSGMWRMDIAGSTTAGMLVRAQNGLGMDVTFTYSSSHALSAAARAANDAWLYEVPMAMPVPVQKTTALGPGETTRKISYSVRDGYWDAAERRFGGFMGTIVTTWGATAAETSSVQTRYHNGVGAGGNNRMLRGKVLVEQVRDGTGRRLSMASNVWDTKVVAGLPDQPLLRRAILLESKTRYEDTVPIRETKVVYQYDELGRARSAHDHGRLDLTDDESIHETRYADDPVTWVRDSVCEEKVLATNGSLLSHTRHLFGDESSVHGLCVVGKGWPRETQGWLANEARFVVQSAHSYDAHGNPIRAYANGVTRELVYDADGLYPIEERVQASDARELVWRATWDPVLGVATRIQDPNGHSTTVRFDALGRAVGFAVDNRPEHMVVQYDWTASFPRSVLWSYDGRADTLGTWPGTWTASGKWRQTVEVSNGLGEPRYSALRLDAGGWIISDYRERDPASRVTFVGQALRVDHLELTARPAGMVGQSLAYDPLGRLLEQRLPNGGRRVFTYTAFDRTMKQDDLALVHHVLDGKGRIRLTQRQLPDGTLERLAAGYDAAGRLVKTSLQDGAVVREFEYDTLGRLTRTSDPDLGVRQLRYDDAGRLIEEINGVQQAVSYVYDEGGRLIERSSGPNAVYHYHYDDARPGSGPSATNVLGRLAWVEEPTGTVDLGYDAEGATSWVRRRIDNRVAEETSVYAASGLVLEQRYDDGFVLAYSYDAAARMVAAGDLWQVVSQDAAGRVLEERFKNGVRTKYERDSMGLVQRITVRDANAAALYDVNVTRKTWGGIDSVQDLDLVGLDHTATFGYDAFARLTGATIGKASGAGTGAPYVFGYQYDGLQNMVQRTASGPSSLGLFAGTYKYGEAGQGRRQLTSVSGAAGVQHVLGYDLAGRQITQDGKTMEYDALDQLVRVGGLPGPTGTNGGVVQHAYGYEGLRLKSVSPTGIPSYWFSEGLSERSGVREHDVVVDGRVVARVKLSQTGAASVLAVPASNGVGVVLTVLPWGLGLLFLGWALVRAGRHSRPLRVSAAAVSMSLLVGACGAPGEDLLSEQAAAWQPSGTTFMHVGIAAGPVLFTDAGGAVVEERRYEPFGEEIDARVRSGSGYVTGAPDFVARDLNGLNKRTEAVTGWSYHGARWMAPETGRWLTPDPPVKVPDEKYLAAPWDLHPYQYVSQNPIVYWDPDGREKDMFDAANEALDRAAKSSTAAAQWLDYNKASLAFLKTVSGQFNRGMALRARMARFSTAVKNYEIAVDHLTDANDELPDDPMAPFDDYGVGGLRPGEEAYVKKYEQNTLIVGGMATQLRDEGAALYMEYIEIRREARAMGMDVDTYSGQVAGEQAQRDLADMELEFDGDIKQRILNGGRTSSRIAKDARTKFNMAQDVLGRSFLSWDTSPE